jgi:hypothetical protein
MSIFRFFNIDSLLLLANNRLWRPRTVNIWRPWNGPNLHHLVGRPEICVERGLQWISVKSAQRLVVHHKVYFFIPVPHRLHSRVGLCLRCLNFACWLGLLAFQLLDLIQLLLDLELDASHVGDVLGWVLGLGHFKVLVSGRTWDGAARHHLLKKFLLLSQNLLRFFGSWVLKTNIRRSLSLGTCWCLNICTSWLHLISLYLKSLSLRVHHPLSGIILCGYILRHILTIGWFAHFLLSVEMLHLQIITRTMGSCLRWPL